MPWSTAAPRGPATTHSTGGPLALDEDLSASRDAEVRPTLPWPWCDQQVQKKGLLASASSKAARLHHQIQIAHAWASKHPQAARLRATPLCLLVSASLPSAAGVKPERHHLSSLFLSPWLSLRLDWAKLLFALLLGCCHPTWRVKAPRPGSPHGAAVYRSKDMQSIVLFFSFPTPSCCFSDTPRP
ncbi:hypothetical protein BD289DRAFT_420946 [Coniella lustricola]|uniref:Uncharacterized protein n=1 Tax=Coniella lustricola TaxID=2025994 RepID=A0A2T3AMS3_9PEZI|nr:hypothetical protein BD289DRAFT_420946 [Coniella lustricola]